MHINDLAAKVATGNFVGIDDIMQFIGRYVQMHFVGKNNSVRETFFGGTWNELPSQNLQEYKKHMKEVENEESGCCIKDIIKENFTYSSN